MVQELCCRGITRLSHAFPTVFDESSVGATTHAMFPEKELQVFGSEDPFPHPFTLISIFCDCRVDKLLPVAFYQVCKQALDKIFSGVHLCGEDICLSPRDIWVAVLGWQSLRNVDTTIMFNVFATPVKPCLGIECNLKTNIKSMRVNLLDLSPPGSMPFTHREGIPFCKDCHKQQPKLEVEGMRRVWEELPGYFELPSWEDLENATENLDFQNFSRKA